MNQDTQDFLETLLWVADTGETRTRHIKDWTIFEFHPEFIEAADTFLSAFRAYLFDKEIDPDDCQRSFGGNVFFSLYGHGVGFSDDSEDIGKICYEELIAFSGNRYRFHELECKLMKIKGKIHLAYRTAAFRREYLDKYFGEFKA